MPSPQTLTDADRRAAAGWAADCAERVLPLFTAEAPSDDRAQDAIARARAYSRGELGAAGEIRRRFEAGRAAKAVTSPAAVAAARAAAQASGVAHMGAHALGAAAYAAHAAGLTGADYAEGVKEEIELQIAHATASVLSALRRLPPVGEDSAGPLGTGLLASGPLAAIIRQLQTSIARRGPG